VHFAPELGSGAVLTEMLPQTDRLLLAGCSGKAPHGRDLRLESVSLPRSRPLQ
jgi:hypothetical protein